VGTRECFWSYPMVRRSIGVQGSSGPTSRTNGPTLFLISSCVHVRITRPTHNLNLPPAAALPLDRAFMDAVAPKLLVLKGDGLVRMFQGSYSEVGRWRLGSGQAAPIPAGSSLRTTSWMGTWRMSMTYIYAFIFNYSSLPAGGSFLIESEESGCRTDSDSSVQ